MYGKKTGKRLLSWVLVLIMALSMLPLNVLADEVGGTGRYVALVDFNTNATVADAGWQDVSTEAGYTAILTAINDLKPDGGTNLDDGLQNANLLFAKSNVQEIDSKNIIALTDGEPTYYMTKDIFGNPTVGGFGNSCTKEVFEATANTAASICNSGTTLYSICFGAANEEVKNPMRSEYVEMLEGQIAKSNNGIVRTKLLTFGVSADSLAAARPRLERVEADISSNFKKLGVQSRPLNGLERLEILHGQLHPGGTEPFRFTWDIIPKTGMGTKDFIAPNNFFRENDNPLHFMRVLTANIDFPLCRSMD